MTMSWTIQEQNVITKFAACIDEWIKGDDGHSQR